MDSAAKNYTYHVKANTKPFSFRCQIDHFPFRMVKIGDKFDCPKFEVGDGVLMFLRLEHTKEEKTDDEALGVRLHKFSEDKDIKLDCLITFVNTQPHNNARGWVEYRLFENAKKHWGWPNFFSYASIIDQNGGFLVDGHRLTVLVEGIAFIEDEKQSEIDTPSDLGLRCEVGDDLGKLFDEGALSDFLVKAKDANGKEKEFKVHRAILAARSKFFAALFSNPAVKECREGVLEVEDIDSGAMEALLRFLYTGKIPPQSDSGDDNGNNQLELLVAAEKYGILVLKNHLERVLAAKLSIENVCGCFVIAGRHSAPFLTARCREFIRLRAGEVIETDGWSQLCATAPKLVGSIITGNTTTEIDVGNDKK